jgi:hypothetical protein
MNERLKELVDKTNDFMHTNYLNWLEAQSFYQSIWQERFSELLIRECAAYVKNSNCFTYASQADLCAERMTQHFGVES